MEQDSNRYNVPMLEKGMELLELLGQHHSGLTIQEMCGCLNYPKTSIYRIANTLAEMGYLAKDEECNRFLLSRRLFRLGLAALGEGTMPERAIEPMRRLRDEVKESVMLGALLGNEAVLLEQILGSHDFTFMLRPGTRLCLHASAPGKVLLAYQNESMRRELLKEVDFVKFNENTITDRGVFNEVLDRVIVDGFATDIEEEISGVHCIGAPVFNQYGEVIACVWVSGPKGRMSLEDFPVLVEKIKECADVISVKMGYKQKVKNK